MDDDGNTFTIERLLNRPVRVGAFTIPFRIIWDMPGALVSADVATLIRESEDRIITAYMRYLAGHKPWPT